MSRRRRVVWGLVLPALAIIGYVGWYLGSSPNGSFGFDLELWQRAALLPTSFVTFLPWAFVVVRFRKPLHRSIVY